MQIHIRRRLFSLTWLLVAIPFMISGIWVPLCHGFGLKGPLAIGMLVGLVVGAIPLSCRLSGWMSRRMPEELEKPWSRWVTLLWGVAALISVIQAARVGVFMADNTVDWGNIIPGSERAARHACLTGYLHSLILVAEGLNPYDLVYNTLAQGVDAPLPETAAHMAPFTLDVFAYPPTFMLFVTPLKAISPDFASARAMFAAVGMLAWSITLWRVGFAIGGKTWSRLCWLGPLVTTSIAVLGSLQYSNFHVLLVVLCAEAWLAFRNKCVALGGLLLSAAILAKYSPVLLGLYLVFRGRWRAVAATCASGIVLIGLSLLIHGTDPWYWFITYQIPNIQSGAAMDFLDSDLIRVVVNLSPFGIPFKLARVGWADWGWDEARLINTIYTLWLFAIVGVAAWRLRHNQESDQHAALVWMGIPLLVALRSTFTGPHVLPAAMILLALLAGEIKGKAEIAAFSTAWISVSGFVLWGSEQLAIAVSLVQVTVLIGWVSWLVVRTPASAPNARG